MKKLEAKKVIDEKASQGSKRPAADDDFEEGGLDDLKKNALKKLKQSKKN